MPLHVVMPASVSPRDAIRKGEAFKIGCKFVSPCRRMLHPYELITAIFGCLMSLWNLDDLVPTPKAR